MRVTFELPVKETLNDDIKSLVRMVDEHAADYGLNGLKLKTVFMSSLDDDLKVFKEVEVND